MALGDVRHLARRDHGRRELKALGFAKISARPRHYAQNELAVDAFKKNFPAELAKIRARLPKGVEIELWWQDEARIGQKNKLTRRWARRGTRPRAPATSARMGYIFGAICPAKGKGAGLVMPWCDTDAMAAHLIEISAAVDPGAHAVLIVDQAGWHLTPKLAIPDNITVLALPPRSPELNPVENVWQFMRDNWLSNRIFKSYEDIVALCCQAWNNLIDQPWKIMSLGMRKWGAWVLINDRWYNGVKDVDRTVRAVRLTGGGCQRRSKISPPGRSKTSPLNVMRYAVLGGCPGSP